MGQTSASGPGTPGPEKSRELEDDLTAVFAPGKKMDLYEQGQGRGIMICPVSTPAGLLQNQQLAARGFFIEKYVPELGRTVNLPGARPDSRAVLAGLRIADFSWVGVGPIATQLLGGLGAEVIRVESTARLDVFRSGGPRRGDSPPDASAYFANVNRDEEIAELTVAGVIE